MLPGKAIRLPTPSQVADEAGPKGHTHPVPRAQEHGAQDVDHVLHRAHLLPKTGKTMNMLPTTARAHSSPATASFFTLD